VRRRNLLSLVAIAAALAVVGVAVGFWSAAGSATASATTLSFNAPGNPQAAISSGTTVGVSWTAAKLTDGVTPATGYYVTRTNVSTSTTSNACGSSAASPLVAGAISCNDSNVPSGTYTYTITAVFHSWTATSVATSSVTVSAGTISLTPASGHVGDSVAISGSGFAPNSSITATYDGSALALAPTGATTSGSGAISGISFTVPASTAGSHTVRVTVAGQTATASYSVTPRVVLSPATGVTGSSATITGSGFAASSAVTATFGGSALTLSGGTSGASGSFSATYTVPNQTAGAKTVVATDASSNSDSAAFTIPTPAITLGSASGNVGDSLTVSGSNFPASATLTGSFGGTSVSLGGTSTTNASGSFTGATLTVPAAPAGARAVQIIAATRSASATFTVIPKISLSPSTGVAGSSDTIVGTGFAASSAITATFGGSPVTLAGTTTTSSTGSFSGATYTVPNQAFGSKTVSVSDASSNNANAAYALHQVSFVIDNPPATVTAGTSFNLTLRAIQDGATDTSYTGSHSLTITGASNSPNGATPTKPASGSFNASGTATLASTLVKAGTENLTISDGTRSVSGSLAVNSAGVTLAWDRACPATVAKNLSATYSALAPNDAFGNTFRRVGGLSVSITSSNTSNFPVTGSPFTITDGPANNTFSIAENGANKTTSLTMTVPTPFTAPSDCTLNAGN
jgi:hypothetical protein